MQQLKIRLTMLPSVPMHLRCKARGENTKIINCVEILTKLQEKVVTQCFDVVAWSLGRASVL